MRLTTFLLVCIAAFSRGKSFPRRTSFAWAGSRGQLNISWHSRTAHKFAKKYPAGEDRSRASARSAAAVRGGRSRHSLSATDFTCASDQSTAEMRSDSNSEICCCRVRCGGDPGCSAGQRACSAEPLCNSIAISGGWATLKRAPTWWHGAPGVEQCREIDQKAASSPHRHDAMRRAWGSHHCGEYTFGPRVLANRTHKLVFDIGFHSGDDTLHFLEQGHDVVAVDANPEMIREGLTRPALHLARQHGRLNAIASGISDHLTSQMLTFYVHDSISEWSRFSKPGPAKRSQFHEIVVPVTTCGELVKRFGVPFYMKVDIEGSDEVCLRSLKAGRLPLYVSTENPLQLDHLISLGYCAFKMVSQVIARRGGRQFSGGMPEAATGAWGDAESIRAHPFFSRRHMHVRIDHNGNRIREEHDLHARMHYCRF